MAAHLGNWTALASSAPCASGLEDSYTRSAAPPGMGRAGVDWGAPRLPDSPSIRMDVWKGEVIASTEEELLS